MQLPLTMMSNHQSKMIVVMEQAHILDMFLTLAANVDDPAFNPYNALLLEIFQLLYRGVKPETLAVDQKAVSSFCHPY